MNSFCFLLKTGIGLFTKWKGEASNAFQIEKQNLHQFNRTSFYEYDSFRTSETFRF